jgi:hypothetical protein
MAAAWKDVPSMYQYDKVPEKALKGSSVSHKTTYVLQSWLAIMR